MDCDRQKEMISVVIPARNEEGNLREVVEGVKLSLAGYEYEIIVVDDNSTDSTPLIAEQISKIDHHVRVIHRRGKPGAGRAIMDGIRASRGDVIVTMDCDLSHDPSHLPKLLERMDGADAVIGSRYMRGGGGGRTSSRIFNMVAKKITGLTDSTSGFRAIRRCIVPSKAPGGFEIHLFLNYVSGRKGRVVEVPILYRRRERGRSKMRIWSMLKYWILLAKLLLRPH